MKGPPITVKCDCGAVEHVPYPGTWTCPTCGRRWNTAQIPSDEYWGIMRQQRRFRIEVMAVALGIGAIVLVLGILQPGRALLLMMLAFGGWFIFFMPQWRRKVRRHARSVPTWKLTPEPE